MITKKVAGHTVQIDNAISMVRIHGHTVNGTMPISDWKALLMTLQSTIESHA